MPLVLTEEQELVRDTAREFVTDNCEIDELRQLRDNRSTTGYNTELWSQMAELGWLGIAFPEDCGGADLGQAELGLVLEEMGRRLVVSPFLSTIVLGGNAVLLAGSDSQKKDILNGVAAGETVLSLAYQETPRHNPFQIETSATQNGDGFTISGKKVLVLDGHIANTLIVAARTSGEAGDEDGLTLFLVDPKSEGVSITRTFLVDSRSAATVEFDGAEVNASAVLGEVGKAGPVLNQVFDRAAVAISAEALGSIQEAFDRTVEYLKNREQFGVKIGTFQALKHRAGRWFCEVELSRSIVMDALRAIDEGRPNVSELASTCKARTSDTLLLSAQEGIQMHGGIGMTDEEDIGFFLKRARISETLMGDAGFHRDRFASLRGY